MTKGRLAELALIAERTAILTYADTAFVTPNRWIPSAIIHDFLDRKLIEQDGTEIWVSEKGRKVLAEKGS